MSFLNTPTWREFQESVGRKTFTLDNKSYLIKLDLLFNKSYLYSPSPDSYKYLDKIKKIAQKEDAIFFKYEPLLKEDKAGGVEHFQTLGFKKAAKELQPQKTIVIDLNKNEEVLLGEMHKKTRYNIRLSEKRGVEVKEADNIEKFWKMLQRTAQRDGFHTHEKEYYKKLFKLDNVKLFCAYKGKNWHAAALVIFDNKRATYLHGASEHKYRKHMGAQLLHWRIMQYAKEKHFRGYDLWGIDQDQWSGITRFKRGFGGDEIEYIGSYDLRFQKMWYALYSFKNKK